MTKSASIHSVPALEINPVPRTRASKLAARYPLYIRCAYYAFVFSVPFDAVTVQYISGGDFTLSKIFGYLLVAMTLVQPRLCYGRLPTAFWCFSAYLCIYLFSGPAQGQPFPSLFGPTLTLVQMMVLFLVSFNLMLSDRIVRGTLWSLGTACTALALLQAMGLTSETIAQDRVSAIGENPNNLAAVLSLGLLALTGLAYGRQKPNLMSRILFILCPAILVIEIVRTGSRGGAIALAVGFLAFALKKGRTVAAKLKILGVVLLLLSALAVVSFQVESVRERWVNTLAYGDTAGRDQIFPAAWEMFLEKPFLGWGPTSFRFELGSRLGIPERDPHNLYLSILNEVGLFGAIPFFLALWVCCRGAWNARLGLQGILPLSMLLCMLTINFKGTYHGKKFFWLVLAYASASPAYINPVARSRSLSNYRILHNEPQPTVLHKLPLHR
jgi:O-antigen ligase